MALVWSHRHQRGLLEQDELPSDGLFCLILVNSPGCLSDQFHCHQTISSFGQVVFPRKKDLRKFRYSHWLKWIGISPWAIRNYCAYTLLVRGSCWLGLIPNQWIFLVVTFIREWFLSDISLTFITCQYEAGTQPFFLPILTPHHPSSSVLFSRMAFCPAWNDRMWSSVWFVAQYSHIAVMYNGGLWKVKSCCLVHYKPIVHPFW